MLAVAKQAEILELHARQVPPVLIASRVGTTERQAEKVISQGRVVKSKRLAVAPDAHLMLIRRSGGGNTALWKCLTHKTNLNKLFLCPDGYLRCLQCYLAQLNTENLW